MVEPSTRIGFRDPQRGDWRPGSPWQQTLDELTGSSDCLGSLRTALRTDVRPDDFRVRPQFCTDEQVRTTQKGRRVVLEI